MRMPSSLAFALVATSAVCLFSSKVEAVDQSCEDLCKSISSALIGGTLLTPSEKDFLQNKCSVDLQNDLARSTPGTSYLFSVGNGTSKDLAKTAAIEQDRVRKEAGGR